MFDKNQIQYKGGKHDKGIEYFSLACEKLTTKSINFETYFNCKYTQEGNT